MNPYSSLAKQALKIYLETGKIMKARKSMPRAMLEQKSGVFVTIEKGEELRGCIGTFLPVYANITEEIIHNAIAAGTEDNRFVPVNLSEIAELTFTVSLLSAPAKVQELEDLDPKKYGVIVRGEKTGRRGLLLPDLPGINTAEKQVMICLEKGGIDPQAEKVSLYRFTVQKYG
ncbi:MAG: AmmeMemoRadiSam system protein A [Candidatus Doudnabacteria bacterium]